MKDSISGFYAIISLFALANSLTIGEYEADFDPGRITWWKSSWTPSPLEPSSDHITGTDLALTFHFNAQTTTGSGGVIEILCPSTVACSVPSITQSVTAGADSSVTFTGVSLTTAKAYGPFGLLTRQLPGAQIIDINRNFAFVAVTGPLPAVASLTVTASDSSLTTAVVGESGEVTFAFTLTADVWKHDIIKLDVPSEYEVSEVPICTSVAVNDITSQLMGPSSTNRTDIPCERDNNNDVVLYGVAQDIDSDGSYQVSLRISTFRQPNSVITSLAEDWELSVLRFGTSTTLLRYAASDLPYSLDPGTITNIGWAPVNGWDLNKMVAAQETFMKLDFTLSHDVPSAGTISIVFDSSTITSRPWAGGDSLDICLVSPYAKILSCVVSGSTATITIGSDGLSAGTISVIVKLEFGATSSSVTEIRSKSETKTIDENISPGLTKTHPLTGVLKLTTFTVGTFTDNSGTTPTGAQGTGTNSVVFNTQSTSALSEYDSGTSQGGVVSVSCSFLVTDAAALRSLYVGSGRIVMADSATATGVPGTTTIEPSDYTLVSGTLSFNVESTQALDLTAGTPVDFLNIMFAESGINSNDIAAPIVLPGISTFYECQAVLEEKDTSSSAYSTGYTLFTFLQNTVSQMNIHHLCDGSSSGAFKVPIVVLAESVELELANSLNYEIVITKTDFGLSAAEDVPVYTTLSGATATLVNSGKIVLSGFSEKLSDGDSTELKQIWISNAGAQAVLTMVLQYPDLVYGQTSSGEDFLVYSKSNNVENTSGIDAFTVSNSIVFTGATPSSSISAEISFTAANTAASKKSLFGLVAPSNYVMSSSVINELTTLKVFNSATQNFPVNMIIAEEKDNGDITGAASTLTVSGIASKAAGTPEFIGFIAPAKSGEFPAPGLCEAYGALAGAMTQGVIAEDSISVATTCAESGPTAYDIEMTVKVPLVSGIPSGGTLVIDLEISTFTIVTALADCTSSSGSCVVTDSDTVTVTANSDISSGVLTITIKGLQGPGDTTPLSSLVASITAADAAGVTIEASSGSDDIGACAIVAVAGAAAVSTIKEVKGYPNSAGVLTDLYIEAQFTAKLGTGTICEFTADPVAGSFSTSAGGLLKDYVWSNVRIRSVSINSSTLTITLDEGIAAADTVKVYIDDQFTMGSTAGAVATAFSVAAKWNDITVSQSAPTGFAFTVGAAASPLSSGSVTHNSTTAGFSSSYAVTFQSSVVLNGANSDLWVVFPQENFNPLVVCETESKKPSDCSTAAEFVDCDSAQLVGISCISDHWVVIVSGFTSVPADTSVTINIYGVCNPEAVQTGTIKVLAVSTASNKYGPEMLGSVEIGTVTPAAVPSVLSLQRVEPGDDELSGSGSYGVSFYFLSAKSLTSAHEVWLEFPWEFEVTRGESFSCSLSYYDEAATSEDKTTAVPIVPAAECTAYYNTLTQSLDSLSTAVATTEEYKVEFIVSVVANPDYGFERTDVDTDLLYDNDDDLAEIVFGTDYKFWSSKFNVMVFDAAGGKVELMSVGNLHAGYIGLRSNQEIIGVNGQGTIDNHPAVKVCTGTCTSFMVTLEDELTLNALKFNPTLPSGSVVSPFYQFKMDKGEDSIELWACVLTSASEGFYYISWSLSGDPSVALFTTPPNTEIEACNCASQAITVAPPPKKFYFGLKSIPIKVSLTNPPASDVTVTVASDNEAVAVITSGHPAGPLTFTSSIREMYFQLKVAELSIDSKVEITFVVSGTDQGAYSAPANWTLESSVFTTPAATTSAGVEVSSVSSVTTNSVSVTVTGKEDGVLFWWVNCGDETESPSVPELLGASNFVSRTGMSPLTEQLRSEHSENEVLTEGGAVDFFYKMLREHCATLYLEAAPCYEDEPLTIDIDWLWAATSYTVGAQLDNLYSTNMSSVKSHSFSTGSAGDVISYAIRAATTTAISSAQAGNIRNYIADSFKFPVEWLISQSIDGAARRLATTESTVSWTLISDPRSNKAPSALITEETALFKLIATELALAPTALSTTQDSLTQADFAVISAVDSSLNVTEYSSESITIEVTVTGEGVSCAVCVEGASAPSSTDVFYRIDEVGNSIAGDCVYFNTTFEIKVPLLSGGTNYNCYVILCSAYPFFPECQKTPAVVPGATPSLLSSATCLSLVLYYSLN